MKNHINWKSIEKDGMPTNEKHGYLVSDGKSIEFSELTYGEWVGGSVFADYEEVSGTTFEFTVKFYCSETEFNLPE